MIGAVLAAVLVAMAPGAVRRVQIQERVVALTFDACATATNAFTFDRPIFDILVHERIRATLFMGGRWIKAHPDEEVFLVSLALNSTEPVGKPESAAESDASRAVQVDSVRVAKC